MSSGYSPSLVSIPVTDTLTKSSLVGLLCFILQDRVHHQEKPGREYKQETGGRNGGRHQRNAASLLAPMASAQLALCATCPGMAPPTSIANQEKVSTDQPAGQSSVEIPSSQVTLVCVTLTKTYLRRCSEPMIVTPSVDSSSSHPVPSLALKCTYFD